jgi:peroxiredoxin
MTTARRIVGLLLLGFALQCWAIAPGSKVPDFRLTDHRGQQHRLYDLSQQKAVVIMIQGNGCPIVRQALPWLQEVQERYRARGVEFLLLNSNLQDTAESIAKEAQEFSIAFPILVDQKQKIGETLGVERTSEVFVIEPRTWKLVYRGPMDDRLHYERQRPPTKLYLTDALDALIAGKPVQVTTADGVGCIVNFPERAKRRRAPSNS